MNRRRNQQNRGELLQASTELVDIDYAGGLKAEPALVRRQFGLAGK